MPQFYFDVATPAGVVRDLEGTHLAGPDKARQEALQTLTELARCHPCPADDQEFKVLVRDAADDLLFKASLHLRGQWLK